LKSAAAPGYTLVGLAANGKATSVRAKGSFTLVLPARRVTLHLRAKSGVYAGPIVVGEDERPRRGVRFEELWVALGEQRQRVAPVPHDDVVGRHGDSERSRVHELHEILIRIAAERRVHPSSPLASSSPSQVSSPKSRATRCSSRVNTTPLTANEQFA